MIRGDNVEKYKFSPNINQAIVNGILQGYRNYIEERKEKQEEMNISTAYAWVKGNHIDDQTAEECKPLKVDFKKAKAGYTWGYLQFNIEDSNKSMFIIKNGAYFDDNNFSKRKGTPSQTKDEKEDNYMKRLSKINEDIYFPEKQSLFTKEQERQMMLFGDKTIKELDKTEETRLLEEFNRFYIVTYDTDDSFAISTISLLMPNPKDDIAYEIEDLSEYIGTSSVSFEDTDFEVLTKESEAPDTPAAEYGIVTEQEIAERKNEK